MVTPAERGAVAITVAPPRLIKLGLAESFSGNGRYVVVLSTTASGSSLVITLNPLCPTGGPASAIERSRRIDQSAGRTDQSTGSGSAVSRGGHAVRSRCSRSIRWPSRRASSPRSSGVIHGIATRARSLPSGSANRT